ncbi:MAG: hypothetical protein H6Q53_246 [Deltaproteobacteria bacterium]|nr:hypothetical protein [Deltaproteobacteria bacterium]
MHNSLKTQEKCPVSWNLSYHVGLQKEDECNLSEQTMPNPREEGLVKLGGNAFLEGII